MDTSINSMEALTYDMETHLNKRIDGVVTEVHRMQAEFSSALAKQGAAIDSIQEGIRSLTSSVKENTPKPVGAIVYFGLVTTLLAILSVGGAYVNLNLGPIQEKVANLVQDVTDMETDYSRSRIEQAYKRGVYDTEISRVNERQDRLVGNTITHQQNIDNLKERVARIEASK